MLSLFAAIAGFAIGWVLARSYERAGWNSLIRQGILPKPKEK